VKRTAFLSLRLHKKPSVKLLGVETPITLPPGCVGISYAFDGPASLAEWEGTETQHCKLEWDEPADARPAPKRDAARKKGGRRG